MVQSVRGLTVSAGDHCTTLPSWSVLVLSEMFLKSLRNVLSRNRPELWRPSLQKSLWTIGRRTGKVGLDPTVPTRAHGWRGGVPAVPSFAGEAFTKPNRFGGGVGLAAP